MPRFTLELQMTPEDQARTALVRANWTPRKEAAARALMAASGNTKFRNPDYPVPPLYMMIVDGLWHDGESRHDLMEALDANYRR